MPRYALLFASAWFLTGALDGCTMPRPDGTYSPEPIAPPPANDAGFEIPEPGEEQPLPPPPDDLPPPPPPPPPPVQPTDAGPDAAPVGPDPADAPYLALTGRYLMRADMYNIAKAKQALASMEVANAGTYFSVAEVTFDVTDPANKKLNINERLCYQQFVHECIDGCSTWETQVDSRVTPKFPYVLRQLTLQGDKLSAPVKAAAYGFDGDAATLPTDKADPRVWDLGGGANIREGVLTRINATGVPILGTIQCDVYTVQRFSSSFDAKLVAGQLHGVSTQDFRTDGSESDRVGATGEDASSCTSQTGEVLPSPKPDTLRFHKLAEGTYDNTRFWACPSAADFAAALPPR